MDKSGAPEVSSLVRPREVSKSPPVTPKSFEMSSLAKEVSKSPPVTTKSSEISSHAKPSKEVSTPKSSWTENEESLLIDERHKKSTDFLKTRNHALLWDEIAEKLFQVLNTKITGTQAMYKYNSLKKRWKEIIDAPSGSAAKKFVHKNAFDEEYGTKASTRPAFVLDTDDDVSAAQSTSNSTCSTSTSTKTFEKKDRKRKYDLHSLIEKQHEDFMTKTTKMHEEKIERLDKFLQLMEQSIRGQKE